MTDDLLSQLASQSTAPLYTRKPTRREQFAEISNTNTQIVDILLDRAKLAQKARKYKEADNLVDIAQLVLDNNKRFQDMVGGILSKSD